MSITRLEDARALKQIGAPLNTPIEERTFTTECSKHWFRVMKAHADFMVAVRSGKRAGTIGKWRALGSKLSNMRLAGAELCGNPPPAPPNFKTEQDEQEAAILQHFLVNRAVPFIEYWEGAIAAVEAGAELTIGPADMPRWLDSSS